MKYKILTLSILLASAAMQSCSDDEPVKGKPVESGTEIEFGASLPNEVQSRTYYGEEYGDDTQKFWPIYWNYEAGKRDEIFIYSPQAMTGRNQASYRVMANDKYFDTAAGIEKLGAFGIQAGKDTETEYKFYALYPASAVKGEATGTTINGTLSGNQTVTFKEFTGEVYKMEPDMKNCLMTGINPGVILTGERVPIQFQPFATALDITVNGPESGSKDITVTQVRITAEDDDITGDFSYDFSTGEVTATGNGSKSMAIDIMNEAGGKGIALKSGQSINLQAFILPASNAKNVKVQVVANDAATWSKTLAINNNDFQSKKILKVNLPYLTGDKAEFDYSIWLSQIDPNIYISELSLPGAALAFNTSENEFKTQTLNIKDLFNAGVRVFQAHIKDSGEELYFSLSDGTLTDKTLSSVIEELVYEMTSAHSDEFCVLALSDYGFQTTEAAFYNTLQKLTLDTNFNKYLATDVNPNTTIAQVKGKIILKFQTNLDNWKTEYPASAFSYMSNWKYLNGANILANCWMDEIRTTGIGYSPLVFGNIGDGISLSHNTETNSEKPAIVCNDESSLMYLSAYPKWNSASWSWYSGVRNPKYHWSSNGSFNLTSVPSYYQSKLNDGMWYIFYENANPGNNNTDLGYTTSGIKNVADAIKTYYNSDLHNKFYMIYCGGAGKSIGLESVTSTLNSKWETVSDDLKNHPYGWVMFNLVGSTSTDECIKAVIDHNLDTTPFTPGRAVAPKNAPTGNNEGAVFGGAIF